MNPVTRSERGFHRKHGGWFLPGMVALAGALAMTLSAGLVRVPGRANDDQKPSEPQQVPDLIVTRVEWLPAGGVVRESLRLFDPMPLFMPDGRGDAAVLAAEGLVERPGKGVTETVPATYLYSNEGPAKGLFRPVLPDSPLAAAERAASSRWFDGLARVDAAGSPGSGRSAMVRMDVYPQSGASTLASIEQPSEPALEAELWRPVELRVLIDAAGAVASPVIIAGSGVGEVDDRVRVLVKQDLLPRLRLRPGAYRLVVGP